MHELTVAQEIIDIVERQLKDTGYRILNEVELEIGRLAGIEYEALEFALKVMAPGTVIEGSRIIIERPEGRMRCSSCGMEFTTRRRDSECPGCGTFKCTVCGGKELKVKSILID